MCEPYTDIWHFATTLYRQPGVETLCLELQHEYGANIPLLLWLLWADLHGESDSTSLDDAHQQAEQWQHLVIAPLRAARTWMKQQALTEAQTALRESIKACELSAEKNLLMQLPKVSGQYRQSALYPASCRYLRGLSADNQHIEKTLAALQHAIATCNPSIKKPC